MICKRSKTIALLSLFSIIVLCIVVSLVVSCVFFASPINYKKKHVEEALITEKIMEKTDSATTSEKSSKTTTESTTTKTTSSKKSTTRRNSDIPCRNGGIYIYESKKCICKEYFSGELCDEGKI
jgi:hypothetical protein